MSQTLPAEKPPSSIIDDEELITRFCSTLFSNPDPSKVPGMPLKSIIRRHSRDHVWQVIGFTSGTPRLRCFCDHFFGGVVFGAVFNGDAPPILRSPAYNSTGEIEGLIYSGDVIDPMDLTIFRKVSRVEYDPGRKVYHESNGRKHAIDRADIAILGKNGVATAYWLK